MSYFLDGEMESEHHLLVEHSKNNGSMLTGLFQGNQHLVDDISAWNN